MAALLLFARIFLQRSTLPVRQKSRWIAGIALSGWDRLGWQGGLAETWMRIHDRRALMGALVLVAGYAALLLTAVIGITGWAWDLPIPQYSSTLHQMFAITATLLVWRLAVRMFFVTRAYGWREGARSVPRALIANIVAIVAARRAVSVYLRMRRDGVVRWEKTAHAFPKDLPGE